MQKNRYTVIGLGELGWDLLPAGKQLGGAPANFAYITSLLGDNGILASRVGSDSLGNEALEQLAKLKLNSAFVQRDPIQQTGTVKVEVDNAGQPCFDITAPVAWDFLEWTSQWRELAPVADAVCFGSLAQRSPTSRATMGNFLHAARPGAILVFDVNLRQNFYSKEILSESLKLATIVKLNHEELPKIMRLLELKNSSESNSARLLLSSYNLKLVCVTRGATGSLLISTNETSEHPGFRVQVADTVGAGDAFTAALVRGYLRATPLDEINKSANRVGAWVASQPGGTPALRKGGLEETLAEVG
jgi:fructokinase